MMTVQTLVCRPLRAWRMLRLRGWRQAEGGRYTEGETNEAGMYKKIKGLMKTRRIQRFTCAFRPRLRGERPMAVTHAQAGSSGLAAGRMRWPPASVGRAPFGGLAIRVWMATTRTNRLRGPHTSLPPPKRKTNPRSCLESTKRGKNKPKTNPNKPSFPRGSVR